MTSYFPDFSEFNGAVDWAALGVAYRAGTISAVAIRAGFGTVRADAQFAANQQGARAQGIPAIYYWFTYPAYNTPTAEAAMFNATVGPLGPGEAMCGDFEDDPSAKPFPRGTAGLQWCRDFLTALQAPQNATWWYTYPSLLSAVGLQALETTWPFWEADYSATPDSAFAPAIARQFTDCGSTSGVQGCCDQSRVLRAPLSQWLTPGIPTGGPEVLDANDPIVQAWSAQIADIYAIATSGSFAANQEQPPPGSGKGTDPWLTLQVKTLAGQLGTLVAGQQQPAVDVSALAAALATHPLTATLSDAERDAIATHVLLHLSKDTTAG